jgi:hypothetical protein
MATKKERELARDAKVDKILEALEEIKLALEALKPKSKK